MTQHLAPRLVRLLAVGLAPALFAGCAMEPPPLLPVPAEPYSAGSKPWIPPDMSALPVRESETVPEAGQGSTEADRELNAQSGAGSGTEPAENAFVGPLLPAKLAGRRKLTIRLKSQRFEYREGGQLVRAGEVSSGSREHPTPRGRFRVLSKEEDKHSRSYTNYFDSPTPMPYALQFKGPYYVHEGWLPGHADSHGCVRLAYEDARFVYERMRVGDPVAVTD